jgi:hypothetical protein
MPLALQLEADWREIGGRWKEKGVERRRRIQLSRDNSPEFYNNNNSSRR